MPKDTPKKAPGCCLSYIGKGYRHEDASGDGYCVDRFVPDGRLKQCRGVIADGECPCSRTNPYSEERAGAAKKLVE